jgi:mRNA interferase RelE/StbE
MALEVAYSRRSARDLADLPVRDRDRVVKRLNAYAAAPEQAYHDVIHLVGTPRYRLRVGDWRVVFKVSEARLDVLRVGHRREVYR